MAGPNPRSFLLTVHEPGSAVLEDLRTGRRVHVPALADLGPRVVALLGDKADEASTPTGKAT